MSNLTNTYTEIINSIPVAGSALSDTSTGAVISTAAQAAILPIGFFNYQSVNKVIQCTGWGIISTPSSATATLTFEVCADSTIGTKATALGTTPTITPASSLSANMWTINCWLTVQSFSTTSAEIIAFGDLTIAGALATTTANQTFQFGSSSPVALATAYSTEYAIELYAIWTTAVSGDTLTCEQWIVQGMN